MPAYDDPYIPGAFAQLSWHVGMDGTLYAREMQTGATYQISPMGSVTPPPSGGGGTDQGGVAEAPADGSTYARKDTQWTPIQIPTAQLVITTIQPVSALESSSVPITVNGTGFTPSSVVNWGGYPLATTFINDTTLAATLSLGPGSSGIYTVVVTDGAALSNSVAFTVTAAAMTFAAPGVSCILDINADGDLIITQTQGPNAGKSFNLTYGEWE